MWERQMRRYLAYRPSEAARISRIYRLLDFAFAWHREHIPAHLLLDTALGVWIGNPTLPGDVVPVQCAPLRYRAEAHRGSFIKQTGIVIDSGDGVSPTGLVTFETFGVPCTLHFRLFCVVPHPPPLLPLRQCIVWIGFPTREDLSASTCQYHLSLFASHQHGSDECRVESAFRTWIC